MIDCDSDMYTWMIVDVFIGCVHVCSSPQLNAQLDEAIPPSWIPEISRTLVHHSTSHPLSSGSPLTITANQRKDGLFQASWNKRHVIHLQIISNIEY